MKIPIQYALTRPERLPCPTKQLNLFDYGTLTFAKPDQETFCCLKAALESIRRGALYPTLVNSANEELVRLFLEGRISFLQIGDTVCRVLELDGSGEVSVESILDAERRGRRFVQESCLGGR